MTPRGVYQRRRGNPWRWPVVIAVALGLVVAGFIGTPQSWIDSFLTPGRPGQGRRTNQPRPWLVLMPPPEIMVQPSRTRIVTADEPESREPVPTADWWREGWRIRIAAAPLSVARPSAIDSVRFLLESLGLQQDLAVRSRPDSLLAVRLLMLRREDAYGFDALKPYLEAMTRARAYADIHSRAADMYDDFLASEIMVPD